MKKVWKYLFITFLLFLGLGCAGVLYLFFVPGSTLFNITYVNEHSKTQSSFYSAEGVDSIEINSRAYDIDVLISDSDSVYLKTKSNAFGFAKSENKVYNVATIYENNKLTFNITEPHGFVTTNFSKIQLFLPTSKAFNLTLSNHKAVVEIDNQDIKINNLKYSTQNGKMSLKKGSLLGNINISLGKGDIVISQDFGTSLNDVTLSLSTGSFKASNSAFGDIIISKNRRGIIQVGSCENLKENSKSAGGRITAKQVMHAEILASDIVVKIDEITAGAIIELTKSGKVTIEKLTGASSISTNSGNINLYQVLSPLTLYSNTGNIAVHSAKYSVFLKNNKGNSTVCFDDLAESYLANHDSRVIYANIGDGHLTATGVDHIGIVNQNSDGGIKITGKGSAHINMRNVYGTNSVAANEGNITIVVDKSDKFVLRTSSTEGSIRVNLSQITDFNGYTDTKSTTTFVNCDSSEHSLTGSSTKGSLTILDTNFA